MMNHEKSNKLVVVFVDNTTEQQIVQLLSTINKKHEFLWNAREKQPTATICLEPNDDWLELANKIETKPIVSDVVYNKNKFLET